MIDQSSLGPPKQQQQQQQQASPMPMGQMPNRKSGYMGPTVNLGSKVTPRQPAPHNALNLPPPPPSPSAGGPAVDEYGTCINSTSPPICRSPPPVQSKISHCPRPSGSSAVPKFAAPTKAQPNTVPGVSPSPQAISSPLMMKKQQNDGLGSPMSPPPGGAAAHMRSGSMTSPQISSASSMSASVSPITSPGMAANNAPNAAFIPPQPQMQQQQQQQVAKARMGGNSDRNSVTRALCDFMIYQLEEGIRLLKKPEFTDARCFVTKDHTKLGIGQLSFDGTNTEGICDTSKADMHDMSTVQEIREITGGKPTIAIVFNNGDKEIEFQCKDPNAYANFIDGMNALLGKAPVTKDRNTDIRNISEMMKIAQVYGPPRIPPRPSN